MTRFTKPRSVDVPDSASVRSSAHDLGAFARAVAARASRAAREGAEHPDATAARIQRTAEVVVDGARRRGGSLVEDVVEGQRSSKTAKRSELGALAGAGIGAALPFVANRIAARRRPSRAARVRAGALAAPRMASAHPIVFAFAAIGGATIALALLLAMRRRRAGAEYTTSGSDMGLADVGPATGLGSGPLQDEVERMEAEGGLVSGDDGTTVAGPAVPQFEQGATMPATNGRGSRLRRQR